MDYSSQPAVPSPTIARRSQIWLTAYCVSAAFGTYFCMYAFRKPFTAATFAGQSVWGVDFKSVLILSQLAGYTASKFIGIRIISEMTRERRARGVLILIGGAQLALLLFALIPPPGNLVCLFLNGLPLGMVFGMVLGQLEGRRVTEALNAGLCASFIVSSGVVKSVGLWLLRLEVVPDYWMPFVVGLVFTPPLLLFTWMLHHIPPPDAIDIDRRRRRSPLTRADRVRFIRAYLPGLAMLSTTYVVLTILRSFRDDFGVELWTEMDPDMQPAVFSQTETLVMFGVVLANAAAIVVVNNRRAFFGATWLILAGLALTAVATVAYRQQGIDAFWFMVLIGVGLYVPYVAYHTTVLERLVPLLRSPSNLGYLMYVVDAVGYLGYCGVLLYRNFGRPPEDFLVPFQLATWILSALGAVCVIGAMCYFRRQFRADPGSPIEP
jgi:hypothetical protein